MRSKSGRTGPTFIEVARRAQIVECAIETIAAEGYAAASLAHIADRAGISKSVIVYHFGSKDQLIEQVIADIFAAAASFVQARLAVESTAGGALRAYIETRVAHLASHRSQMVALFHIWSSFRTPEGQLRLDERTAEPGLQAIEAILRRGQEQGEFGDFSPRVMAVAVRQAIDGVMLQSMVKPDLDLDLYSSELVRLFDRATRRRA